jgi:M6 family metalloprotease-like protein
MHTFAQKPEATQQTNPKPSIRMVEEVLRSPGRPLDAETRAVMEPHFGHDFSKVRVHTDTSANESAHAINALAYTVGPQIVFGAGHYRPGTTTGRQLLAHELTHVVQQQGQPSALHSLRVGPSSDAYEAEAERTATTATSHGALHTTEHAPGVIQRQKAGPIQAQPHTQGNTGRKSKRLLVVLWDPHRDNQGQRPTPQQIGEAIFGSQPTSLREFYRNQSNQQEAIDKVAVLGWYDAKKPADHYWNHPKNAGDDYDDGHNEKWAEALQDADSEIDFKSFDDNKDGKLTPDELAILIVIPQKNPFGTSKGVPLAPKKAALVLDGVQIGPISEVYLPFPINAGVIRHELGHLLFDFPDTYANKTYPGHGADDYSIMAVSYTDAQIDAPTRIGKGWVNDNPIAHSGTYAIGSIEDTHEAFTFTRPGSKPREYFAIEKRVAGKYDNQLPQGGLVIWRMVDSGNPEDLYRFTPGGQGAWPMDQPLSNFVLNWSDGKDSGVRISVDPKMQGMAFTIVIPAAGATPAGRP